VVIYREGEPPENYMAAAEELAEEMVEEDEREAEKAKDAE